MTIRYITKKTITIFCITLLAITQSAIARREKTIKEVTVENRSPFMLQVRREVDALSKKTELNRNVELSTVDSGPRGDFQTIMLDGTQNKDKGVRKTLASNIDDINEEDIREYSFHIKDPESNDWIEIGRGLIGISCNIANIGVIPTRDYTNKTAVDHFDNFTKCNQETYDKIEGNVLANYSKLATSWGYLWLPKSGAVNLSDGSTVEYNLYAGMAFESNGVFPTGGFLVQLTQIKKPEAGSPCTKSSRPGTLGDDNKCHWISCTTASGLPGFKEADGDCTIEGCAFKGNIPGVLGKDGVTCIAAAGLSCSTDIIAEGTTDASGNCVAKPGQECIVENSHGSKGVTIAQGKCVGIAGGECMTPEGLGGEWSNDGKTCYVKTGVHCVTKDGKDGIMGDNGKCNKKDGEPCIDTALSAEGIMQGGSCVATIGEECLAGNQIGTIEIKDGARVCKMKTAQPGTGQACVDSATHAKGFVDDAGKCIPEDGALCSIEGQDGTIQNGACSAKTAQPATPKTPAAKTPSGTGRQARSTSTSRTRTRGTSTTRTR